MWNNKAVINFNPITGKLISKINIPVLNVTSCAFGEIHLGTLFTTTAKQGND